MRYIFPVLFLFSSLLFAQEDSIAPVKRIDTTRLQKKLPEKKPPKKAAQETIEIGIKDYKIISHARDTTFLDTTLTLKKEYTYNYLRKDDFELLPFPNVGQPYNRLGVNFERISLYPRIGAEARHANYMEVEDITYFNVATPMTDLMFKTTFEQGQLLDATLTFNTSPRLNFSIAYKGFRSLGKYQFNQTESGNFRTTANYETKNGRYNFRAHIAAQDLESQENGGITNPIDQFESGEAEFTDRSRIDVNLTDATNRILGKRYFFEHQYKLVKKERDSGQSKATSLAFGHLFSYETKFYQFDQTNQNDFLGTNTFGAEIMDRARLKTSFNEVSAIFSNNTLGNLKGIINLYDYSYFFNSILITDTGQIDNGLNGQEISAGADYSKQIGGFKVDGRVRYTVSGELTDNLLEASASYSLSDKHKVTVGIHSSAAMPNFNYLLYQSDYQNFNWQNSSTFENQSINSLRFSLESQVWGNLTAKYTTVDNYTYFASEATQEQIDAGQENAFIKPFQEGNSVNHLKIKYEKEFRLGKFALANTVMYQNVSQTNEVLNVPQLVTRNTLYFSDEVFKKAMYIQTGINFKYFTSYNMNSYNPLLGEFYIQNREEQGGFPLLDFFINARVRQTRIYLKAEHFNSSFSGYNFYSAPNYPYRDFVIRFGLVWNFFS
ncbi:putative porin [Spongiimicrobium sp. 3-5]|uniref:putative porin n=1 Tax=Spongiimicrobium sp. 3-5 TaxID=3332596 RepID=UPI00397E93CB